MRKLLLFLSFVLVAMVACALIPWRSPGTAPAPTLAATFTPVVIAPTSLPPRPTQALPTAVVTEPPVPTATAVMPPTIVPSPTIPPALLSIQPGTPRYLPAFPHADLGCAWAGIAGQVLSENGEGYAGAVVVLSGSVNGQAVERIALAGSAPGYGPGGYEMDLSAFREHGGVLAHIQVFNLNGEPLSGVHTVQLPPSCAENLAIITFQLKSTANMGFLPVIH